MFNSRNVNPCHLSLLTRIRYIDGEIQFLKKSAIEIHLIQSSKNISLQFVYYILDNPPCGPGGDNLIDSSGKRKYFVSFFFTQISHKYK